MRLKIIVLCCLMGGLFLKQARSTHVIGGEIFYECLNSSVGMYEFTVKLYRDCYSGVPPFDDPIYISIYRMDSSGSFVLFIQMDMSLPPSDTLENFTYNYCQEPPPNICIEEAIYKQTYILPPDEYWFTYMRCCRNAGIVNIPNPTGAGFAFDISVPDLGVGQGNSSPAFTNYPPTIICLDEAFSYDHSATEKDGDSLVYYLCAPNDYNNTTWGIVPNPSGPPNANLTIAYVNPYDSLYPIWAPADSFRIDPITGLLTGTPTQAGSYVIAVCVSEYRNGVLLSTNSRDFQFNVAACLSDPMTYFTWTPDTNDPCQIDFTYQGNDVGSFDWNFGAGGFVSDDTSSLENPSYTYLGSGSYTVSLIVNQSLGCPDTLDVAVTVSGCPFVSIPELKAKQILIYPNPGSGTFTIDLGLKWRQGDVSIQVYHMDGRLVLDKTSLAPNANNSYTLKLNGVSKGIYLVKVDLGNRVLTKRLIVL